MIENQGFRELTQAGALDPLAGRRFHALNRRIAFALMRYNAERVLRMKHPGPCPEERERLRGGDCPLERLLERIQSKPPREA